MELCVIVEVALRRGCQTPPPAWRMQPAFKSRERNAWRWPPDELFSNCVTEELLIRKAELRDATAIAGFNRSMALETEARTLMQERVDAGVLRLLSDASLGFYVVAESRAQLVGCLMVTNEWSDWRNGLFWWIQSVYVEPGWRRQGIYRRLYDFVRGLARSDPGVCGFRLYVERENTAAQRTYASLGMTQTGYLVFEESKPGVRYFDEPIHEPDPHAPRGA
jgi:ribosomal protein S18 acetylase RimI-like enzyme